MNPTPSRVPVKPTEHARPAESLRSVPGWRKSSGERAGQLSDCCLVVPTYRRVNEIIALMKALCAQEELPAEVVVVDGTPDDSVQCRLREFASGRSLPFDLLYVKSPSGLTRQRNVGIDASRGEYVFFLDDDCIPRSGYFRTIREVFEGDRDGAIGAVCGTILNEIDRPLSLRWKLRLALGLAPRHGRPGTYYPTATSVPLALAKPFSGIRDVDMLPGCTMAFRRRVLETSRFSAFFHGYAQGEDLEMSMRVRRGWRLVWSGDAHVEHHHAPGGRPKWFEKGRMEIRNRYFIWQRYTPHPSIRCRLHLWADFGYIFFYDLAGFVAHPRQPGYLALAFGVARGCLECLFQPPRHEESGARCEYEVHASNLDLVTNPVASVA